MKRSVVNSLKFAAAAVAVLLLGGAGCTSSPVDDNPEPDPSPRPGTGEYAAVNRWMFDYLESMYFWNRAVQRTEPDDQLDYEEFLDDILLQVAAQGDVNHDDGHWENGRRTSFYSYIWRYSTDLSAAHATRAGVEQTVSGYGFEQLYAYYLDANRKYCGFAVASVHPNGPAARAGLKRGDLISRINGERIVIGQNEEQWWNALYYDEQGTVRLTCCDPDTGEESSSAVTLTAASYDDNPLFEQRVLETSDGRRVGYLDYVSFNMHYDEPLIAAFAEFKLRQIDELVLDLRYNGGGHVVSSTVLGTLVAGEPHRGGIYARTVYNEDRQAEVPGVYRIGEASYKSGVSSARYQPIAGALSASLGLDRVYVITTERTASASELVINGLRGLGIEVRIVGERTNGKNVGMEVTERTFGSYRYEFAPITFYTENAEGFRDYSDGFVPDVAWDDRPWWYVGQVDEAGDPVYDEAGNRVIARIEPGIQSDPEHDDLMLLTMYWIETGQSPTVAASKKVSQALTRSERHRLQPVPLHRAEARRHRPDALLIPAAEE